MELNLTTNHRYLFHDSMNTSKALVYIMDNQFLPSMPHLTQKVGSVYKGFKKLITALYGGYITLDTYLSTQT